MRSEAENAGSSTVEDSSAGSTRTAGRAARRHGVRSLGNPAGRAMLLVHGFGTDQRAWDQVVPALGVDHRLVLVDQAGAGSFDPAAYERGKYSALDGYAADLVELCAELDLHDVVLVGHSVSSMISARASLLAPELFTQLVMIAPSSRYVDDPAVGYDGGFSAEDIDELLDSLDQNYLSWTASVGALVMGNADRPELGAELTESFRELHPGTARDFARATFRTDSRELLGSVVTPTLVLQCREDVLAPATAVREVAARLPHATLVELEAFGHCPHLSHPDVTAAAILTHLARRP